MIISSLSEVKSVSVLQSMSVKIKEMSMVLNCKCKAW